MLLPSSADPPPLSSSPAKSRREAPPSPPVPNPVIDKAPSRRAEPDEQLQFQGGELR